MTDKIRLKTILTEFNISIQRVVDFLYKKNIKIASNPNVKINKIVHQLLIDEFKSDKEIHDASEKISIQNRKEKEKIREELLKHNNTDIIRAKADQLVGPKTLGKIDLQFYNKNNFFKKNQPKNKYNKISSFSNEKKYVENKKEFQKENIDKIKQDKSYQKIQDKPQHIQTQYMKLSGLMLTGDKVDLSQFERKKSSLFLDDPKKKRKRIKKEITIEETEKTIKQKLNDNIIKREKDKRTDKSLNVFKYKKEKVKTKNIKYPNKDQVKKHIKETLEKINSKGYKQKYSKIKKEKRIYRKEKTLLKNDINKKENKILKIAEFATVNELSAMMKVPESKVILTCMSIGIMATLNQRLDAETISLVAEEFGYNTEFVGVLQDVYQDDIDSEEDLHPRPPIVTVMGHVDHGKTSLIDYIRKTNVIAGEFGGITQHIGAYSVTVNKNKHITILDTPGHEAFTAMRARGAQITDIAIIVIAADDEVMPQTKEAINHAQMAGVPMIFAINKIDRNTAQPEKIREQLANMNILLEEWGGKYQSQEISAKTGMGVDKLLEKILLEAEILDLKANPKKNALGVVIEATIDKGRGYVTTVLIQAGNLIPGDYILAGSYHGKVKAILDERGRNILQAGPSRSVTILGLNGAPSAGDKFKVFKDEKEAKQIASYRGQLQREQNIRSQKHITLDEIGRRIALGDFKELKIIIKGDVDGSVEALSDSLQKLSTDSIIINIIHKGVGQITESDVLLASASNAIIIGFNVRPANNAKNISERENIEIRTYSIIYDIINDVKEAMQGLVSPEIRDQMIGLAEVRGVFKVAKLGNIAGCMVTEGKIIRYSKVKLIREGIVVYNGYLGSLKRFKDDVKEVLKGYECGISIKNYNNIKIYDVIEAYEEIKINKIL